MVHIVAASSLHRAIATLPYLIKRELKPKVTTIPGLTFNPRAKPLKNLRNLLEKGCLKDVRDIIIWHDVLNNTITPPQRNSTGDAAESYRNYPEFQRSNFGSNLL